MRELAQALLQLYETGQRGALATVVRVSGSAPQEPGARLLLRADGSTLGTVGGGALEHAVMDSLREVLQGGQARLLVHQLGHDLGMCCGGRMEVFVEPIASAPQLIVCGAGHVARAVAVLARSVGFELTVIDERDVLLTAERFVGCRLELQDPISFLRRAPLDERHFLLIATHDHALDGDILTLALSQAARYIGLLGSKRKVLRLLQRARTIRGEANCDPLYGPVGIDIGAVSPEEIAVSIVAELLAVRRGKSVPHMRVGLSATDDAPAEAPHAAAPAPAGIASEARATQGAATQDRATQTSGEDPQPPAAGGESGLAELEARVQDELERLRYPQRDWLWSRQSAGGESIYDVIVVGAGQGGLASAFGLMRERVTNLLVLDQNPLDRAGPWLNFARMPNLRTPKHLTGPDLGVPSLTPRAWYEARHGRQAWEALRFMPRASWAEYLAWYRRILQIPVQAETRVGALRWNADERAFELPCMQLGHAGSRLLARRVVLATGIEGSGRWHVPALISAALPASRYAHTSQPIDFAALANKRVAVLGAGASAFDNAATALEHGAREVRLFCRRAGLVDVNPYRWAEFAGFLAHAGELPDADKWRFIERIVTMGQLPPADSYRRAAEHPNFHLHAGAAWRALRTEPGGQAAAITIETDAGTFETDFVIVGTGFVTDLSLRPELAQLEPLIARWADRFTPPEGERHEDLARHPYLGRHFEFQERTAGTAPYLAYLYNYTFGGLLSLGFGGASLSGMKYSVARLVAGVAGSLFLEDREEHLQSLRKFAQKEF